MFLVFFKKIDYHINVEDGVEKNGEGAGVHRLCNGT